MTAEAIPADTVKKSRLDIVGALKDAALAALIAFGLFSLLIGVRTNHGPGGLIYHTRFDDVALLVGAVFVGSLVRALFFGEAPMRAGGIVAIPRSD